MKKKNRELLTALHFKLLYNINRSENGVKNIQAAAYICARTVVTYMILFERSLRDCFSFYISFHHFQRSLNTQ